MRAAGVEQNPLCCLAARQQRHLTIQAVSSATIWGLQWDALTTLKSKQKLLNQAIVAHNYEDVEGYHLVPWASFIIAAAAGHGCISSLLGMYE